MIYGFFGIIILFVFVFQMKSTQNKYGGGGGGLGWIPPLPRTLASFPHVPHCFNPKKTIL